MLKYLKYKTLRKSWCPGKANVKTVCQFKAIFKQPQNLTLRGKSITNGRRLQFYSVAVFTKIFKTVKH